MKEITNCAKGVEDYHKLHNFISAAKQKFNVSRNMRQVIHINEICIENNSQKRYHVLAHPILQRELLKFKREIKKNLKSIKDKDKLRNIKVLKF